MSKFFEKHQWIPVLVNFLAGVAAVLLAAPEVEAITDTPMLQVPLLFIPMAAGVFAAGTAVSIVDFVIALIER